MGRFDLRVDFVDRSQLLNKKVKKAMKEAMLDVTLDLKRVASASAPHDTGYLEKNAQHEVYVGSQYLEGTVGFSAVEKGFNYAEWTHDNKYNLGAKSAKKKGGRSKFGSGIVPVGQGYLENALNNNKQGYLDHIKDKYREAIQ